MFLSLTTSNPLAACWLLYSRRFLSIPQPESSTDFCHPRSDQLKAAHVADDDVLILIDYFPRKLVQGIGAAARRLAVNALGLAFVTPALRAGEPLGITLSPAPSGKTLPVTGDRDLL